MLISIPKRTETFQIDEEDLSKLDGCDIYLSSRGYVILYNRNTKQLHRLQRVIIEPIEGYVVDHINGDKLDNRKNNLRAITQGGNLVNKRSSSSNGLKGVEKNGKRWCARIGPREDRRYLGQYNTKEEAARAYDKAAKEIYGKLAKTNYA